MSQTIPAMPMRDVAAGVDFYRERLGFDVVHHDGGFAVLRRDEAVVHLWEASDGAGTSAIRSRRPCAPERSR